MPYIKLLTVLAGLALLTACGGGGKTADNAGKSANSCIENPFGATCSADDSTIISLRQSVCLEDTTADPSCLGETGIATVFCKDNPFHNSNACRADTGAIASRQTQCVEDAMTNPTCGGVIANFCKTNPFQESACLPNDTYLPLRIADCIKDGKADTPNCGLITQDTAKNTALTACLTNPFEEACESVDDFTTFALARTNRLTFCDNSDNVADDLCTGDVVMPICGLDPFNAICFTDNTYLSDRAEDCIMAGNAGEEKCNTIFTESASNTCLTNPFTDACKADGAFGTYADMARTNRVTFCESGSGEICTALTACQDNPFATECEAYFETTRENRVSFCDMSGNAGNAFCIGANVAIICEFDIFSTLCTDSSYLPNRQSRCVADSTPHMSCSTLLSGLVDATDLPTYPDLPATTRTTGFLKGEEMGIDTTGFTPVVANTDSLNFTATAGTGDAMVSLNGLATDGVAWARIDFTGDVSDGFYAGILSGTNMGAPLVKPATATGAKVTWKGIIQGTDNTGALDARPFTLNVDLYDETLKAFVLHPTDANFAFSIDGTYTAEGIISGTTLFGVYMNRDIADQRTLNSNFSFTGTLTGLIGEKGAVAAFHSNTPSNGYSGGFIAVPPAPSNGN